MDMYYTSCFDECCAIFVLAGSILLIVLAVIFIVT